MKAFTTPRLWIFIWGGLGALFLVYVIISASVQPRDLNRSSKCSISVKDRDQALLTGDMIGFTYAFPPRGMPEAFFQFDGEDLTLADFRGKTILVNFWATWCPPCVKELPSLNGLQGRLGSDEFEVVAVAADPKGPEIAREFLARHNINNLKLYTDQRLRLTGAIGGGAVLPISILYSQDGKEIGRLIGEADWESPEAIRLVQNAIDCS